MSTYETSIFEQLRKLLNNLEGAVDAMSGVGCTPAPADPFPADGTNSDKYNWPVRQQSRKQGGNSCPAPPSINEPQNKVIYIDFSRHGKR